jgi:hypothetical protein
MTESNLPSPTVRNVISAILAFHFSLLILLLAGNVAASPLQTALRSAFGGYVQLLHIDPDYRPLHLTGAELTDTSHLIEITEDPTGESGWRPLRTTWRGSAARYRLLRIGQMLAGHVELENQTATAQIAQSLAAYANRHENVPPRRIRVRRHLLQDSLELRNGNGRRDDDSSFFTVLYEANVLIDSNGGVKINKVDGQMETAAPVANEPASEKRGEERGDNR